MLLERLYRERRKIIQTPPDELRGAAKIDGAGELYPGHPDRHPPVPGIISLSVFACRDSWNNCLRQLIALFLVFQKSIIAGIAKNAAKG